MPDSAPALLLVDDDAALLEALTLFLRDEGYVVHGSPSGDALRRLMSGDDALPQAIILDMLLSGENGRNLCEELKKHPRTSHVPVILMSAHPLAERHAMQSGADAFVAKPFEVDDLLESIARHQATPQLETSPDPISSAADCASSSPTSQCSAELIRSA